MIEFPQINHLVIYLHDQGIPARLDHWLSLVHYTNYQPIMGPKHSLYLWLHNVMNAQIYMNVVCTLIAYTQSTIHTQGMGDLLNSTWDTMQSQFTLNFQ